MEIESCQPTRRRFLTQGSAALLGLAAGRSTGQEQVKPPLPDGSASRGMITPAAQRAIARGLEYLASEQRRNGDGSFGERQYRGNVAITGLAALAMMAAGHQPGRGKYGKVVTDALKFILDQEDRVRPGFFHRPNGALHGPMYEHGFGTLFLAEVHGMVHDRELRTQLQDKLKQAIAVIIQCQNSEGGWRYKPASPDADISVTICQIMALRAARNAGFYVPKSVVDKCTEYVKACQSSDGGFRYMKQGGPTRFALTAAGVVALHSAGIYQGPEITQGLNYLVKELPFHTGLRRDDLHYFYGHYYGVQAMWTAGGSWWSKWFPTVRDDLIRRSEHPQANGVWSDTLYTHYATAMACIILQVPNNYLAILQK